MAKIYRLIFAEDDTDEQDRLTTSLAGLAVTLLVLVCCVFLMKELHKKAAIEDCLLAGRNNCDTVIANLH